MNIFTVVVTYNCKKKQRNQGKAHGTITSSFCYSASV